MKKRELEIRLTRDFVVGENKETNLTYTLLSELLKFLVDISGMTFPLSKRK